MQRRSYRKLFSILSIAFLIFSIAFTCFGCNNKGYNKKDHAEGMSADELRQYNYAITVFAQNKNKINSNDVLIMDTMRKERGGDTLITFVIYQYASFSDMNQALRMTAEEIASDSRFVYMGTGEVTLGNDQIAQMKNIKTVYIQ